MVAKVFLRSPWIKTAWDSWVKASPLLVCILCSACFTIGAAEKSYKIRLEKFELVSSDETLGNFSNVEMIKYNRSVSALNGSFELIQQPRSDLLVSIEGYEKIGTQYMLSGIQVKEDILCSLLEKYGGLIISPDDTITTNFKFKCPVDKGTYFIVNYRPDERNLPEDVPGNDWRFDLKGRYPEQVDTFLFHFQIFLQVERDVANWKPSMK